MTLFEQLFNECYRPTLSTLEILFSNCHAIEEQRLWPSNLLLTAAKSWPQGRVPEEPRCPTQGVGRRNRQAPRERSRLEGPSQGRLGSEVGGLRYETGCSPHQAGRDRSLQRRCLERCPKGSPVRLGGTGQSRPRRVARVLIDQSLRKQSLG